MIVSKVRGGLGNQLFTYAAGRALSSLHKSSLVLDASWYLGGNRPFLLGHFNIRGDVSFHDHSSADDGVGFNQASWGFYPEFLHYEGYKFLSGWWQSEKFFAFSANYIRAELRPKNPVALERAKGNVASLKADIQRPVVAVHCRRGDYLPLANKGLFNVLSMDYYRRAMSFFDKGSNFIIFSDDAEWCKQHFEGLNIRICSEEDPITALLMMTCCDHYIIANSTFSWWGAWLGEKMPNTKVVAPSPNQWFGPLNNKDRVVDDIIPNRWKQIES